MTSSVESRIDWHHWRDRWEAQQAAYTVDWEGRYAIMLDAVEALLPEAFVAIDIASGPGTISRRLLDRFPRARCIAVDLDPVLLSMGQATLGTAEGRLRWVEADLKSAAWLTALGEEQVDAVLSSTALHWLPAEHLVRLYRELGTIIRPGGVFLNGDNMRFGPELPAFSALSQWRRDRLWSDDSFAARDQENWQQWWDALAREPAAANLLAERERRFGWMKEANIGWTQPIFDVHVAALRDAGFREVGTIWQSVTNRVLMAVR
ncbi:MAG: trans-aconitate 2-methyltransferase [Dehalococcoidia bacterium]